MSLATRICSLLILLTAALASQAQGLLIDIRSDHAYRLPRPIILPRPRPQPRPQSSYKIKQLDVQVNLQDQVAKMQMTQSFVNTGRTTMEVCFVFPLPHDAVVDQMTFMVDSKEYEAKLLTAEEARRIYEGYIRRNKDPALLEWMGWGMLKTSVFPVPPGAERKVTLKFSQVCKKDGGLTELMFPLSTAKYTATAVEEVTVSVHVRSKADIKNVYVPTHDVKIDRSGDNNAHITYRATNQVPTADFRLMYDVGDADVGASVISYRPDSDEEGYFLMLVSPKIKQASNKPLPKTVVFVLDRSGSMTGKKIEQAKASLRFVLNNLNEGDLFNIVAYDNSVESFAPELQRYSDTSRKEALGFVESIYAGGSTNIDGALKTALAQLQDKQRPSFVIFLTDGLPTAGEKNEGQIVQNARQRNQLEARIFSMGVGYDVNSRLLDRLSRTGFGSSEYVRPDEDIEIYVSRLYNRIGAPALTNVDIDFDREDFPTERGSFVSRTYPKRVYDLFAGDQLVLVGRYKKGGDAKVVIRGDVADRRQQFDFPARFVDKSHDETYAFVEKLWAMRRVGEIIDEIDLNGKNQELVTELVQLATRHGILTPYTSFLADDQARLGDLARRVDRAGVALEALSASEGRSAFDQRAAKGQLQKLKRAPSNRFGGRGFGLQQSGARGGSSRVAGGAALPAPAADADAEPAEAASNVMHVGSKTFYRRRTRWVDSKFDDKLEKKQVTVKRFSQAYFDLVKKHGDRVAKYLAIEGDVTFVVDGQAYKLED